MNKLMEELMNAVMIPEVREISRAMRRASELLYQTAAMVTPFIGLTDAREANTAERFERTLGKMLGGVAALTILRITKPGVDPRETQVFKSMQESFAEMVDAHKSGEVPCPPDPHHAKIMEVLDGLSAGGNTKEALDKAIKLLEEAVRHGR